MRKDLFKVIVEQPRRGVRTAHRVKSRLDRSPDRIKIGMKRSAWEQKGTIKLLNENLAPLQRYLRKQLGRPWDKVYSEICARLDTRSTVKQHVRDHLEDLIVLKALEGQMESCWSSDVGETRGCSMSPTENSTSTPGTGSSRRPQH